MNESGESDESDESDGVMPKSSADGSGGEGRGVGQRLSAARKKWGLSVQEAAQCLNLSADTITALEQDAYERLPGKTFALGYLRAYAKLLKLDHEQLIARVRLENEEACEILYAKMPVRRTVPHRGRPNKRGGGFFRILLVVVVLAGLIGFAVNQLPGPGVNKILEAIGLSLPASVDEKTFGTPFPTDDGESGDQQEPLLKTE